MSQCFYRVSRILWYTISVKIPRHQMRGIKSKTHNLGTYKTNKISWSCFDDKRYFLRNGIKAFVNGHKDI